MKRIFISTILIVGLLMCIITLKPKTNYQELDSKELKSSNLIGIYLKDTGDYYQVKELPSEGNYALNKEKSYCLKPDSKDTKINDMLEYNPTSKTLSVSKLADNNTKCYLYFDLNLTPSEKNLAKLNLTKSKEGCPNIIDGITQVTGPENSQNLICSAEDDDGESIYFRGTTKNNWVKFGQTKNNEDIWWRIIRINGNGTIRLIYAGVGSDFGTTGNGTNAIKAVYNTKFQDNTYVGFYYGSEGGSNYNSTHSNTTKSNIVTELEKWFNETDLSTTNRNKIDNDTGFCNDRQPSTSKTSINGQGGTGTTETYYGAYIRLASGKDGNQIPTLKCSSTGKGDAVYNRDYFTVKNATQGNRKLDVPVGLITADEVVLAGGSAKEYDKGSWLFIEANFWTMSPYYISFLASANDWRGYDAYMTDFNILGMATEELVVFESGVRPVINLKADTQFEPSNNNGEWGTTTNPYIVSE